MNHNLRVLASNALILFVKLNTLHFLVKGSQFQRVHQTTDDYYEYFKEVYDEINERLVQKNEQPVHSLAEALGLAKGAISELSIEDKAFSAMEVFSICLIDFTIFKRLLSKDIDTFIKNGDTVSEDLLRGYKAYLEKEIWFLRAQVTCIKNK